MKKLILAAALILLLGTGNALAISPIDIDGSNSGEWATGWIINATDPNEGTIPNDYDIERVVMISESGGANDGLYVLIDLYGTPTFTSLDLFPPYDEVFYTTGIDVNMDGDYTDSVDRSFDYRLAGFTVYDGTGTPVSGSPTYVMGSVVEFYIPASMFAGFPIGGFNTASLLDNGGGEAPDDRIPDTGYNTTIPEPTSMLLFGMGTLGLLGLIRRKT